MATRHPRRDRRTFRDQATNTRYIIAFHSHEGFDGIVNGAHPLLGKIVGVSTSKSFGPASGTFTITMKKPSRFPGSWSRLWRDPENTWVRISCVVDGQVIAQTWGSVDTVKEAITRSGEGARDETYVISGRDVGKPLEVTKVFVNLFNTSAVRSIIGTQAAISGQVISGTPETFVRTLLEIWLGNNGMTEKQWELPQSMWRAGGLSFYDALNRTTIQEMNAGNGLTVDPTLLHPDQMSGTPLWDVLQQYCNGLMNEMWVDLAPRPTDLRNLAALEPAFYLRERMFKTHENRRRWDSLRTRVLEPGDIRSPNVVKGGAANRFNYWNMTGGMLGSGYGQQELVQDLGQDAYKPGSIPIINSESIRKHGLRPYNASSDFLAWNGPDGANFLTLAGNWLKRLHDWYSVAQMQLSGTITTTRIFPEIRIGEKVLTRTEDGNIFYYVEAVDHDWHHPGPGSTTVTVTHGEYQKDDLLGFIYAQYDNPATVTQDDCTDLIKPTAAFTSIDTKDDLLAQLAAGCRLTAPLASMDQEQQSLSDPGSFDINGVSVTQEELQGLGASGRGLISEGAEPFERVLGITPDPEMIPSLSDIDAAHAENIATGGTTKTVPDVEADAEAETLSLTESDLEEGRPIPVELAADPLAGIDPNSDDPLAGIEEDLGLP